MSSSSDAACTAAPWADLLPELCNLVLDRLDVVGVIRFPAVCKQWAAAASELKTHRPPLPSGSPTLLTSSLDPEGYDREYDMEPGAFALHDVATGKSYYGEAEGLKKRTWVGGKDDWLVTTDLRCGVELLNPITGARVSLPSFATIPGVEVLKVSERGPGVSFQNTRYGLRFRKVTLCRTPTHPSGYLAVALFTSISDDTGLVAFTAAGVERWTPLMNSPEGFNGYTDVTVHEGKVLAVARYGNICSWDMDDGGGGGTASEPSILPPLGIDIDYSCTSCVFYLATSSGGALQLVSMFGDNEDTGIIDERWWRILFDFRWSFWSRRVLLHELDVVTGTWRRVEELGGGRRALFGLVWM